MSDNSDNGDNGQHVPHHDADNSASQDAASDASITPPPETPSATDCSLPPTPQPPPTPEPPTTPQLTNIPQLPTTPQMNRLQNLTLDSPSARSSVPWAPLLSAALQDLPLTSDGSSAPGQFSIPQPPTLAGSGSPGQLSSTHSTVPSPLATESGGFRLPGSPSSLSMGASNSPVSSPMPRSTSDAEAESSKADPSNVDPGRAKTSHLGLHERRRGVPIIGVQIEQGDGSSEPQDNVDKSHCPGSGSSELRETYSGEGATKQSTPEKAASGITSTDSSDSVFLHGDDPGLAATGSDNTQPVGAVPGTGISEQPTQPKADSGIETALAGYSSTESTKFKRVKPTFDEYAGKRSRRVEAASATTVSVAPMTRSRSLEPMDVDPDKDIGEPCRPSGSTAAVAGPSTAASEHAAAVSGHDASEPSPPPNRAAAGNTAAVAVLSTTGSGDAERAAAPGRSGAAAASTVAVACSSTAARSGTAQPEAVLCGADASQREDAPTAERPPSCIPCFIDLDLGEKIEAARELFDWVKRQFLQARDTVLLAKEIIKVGWEHIKATNKVQGITHIQGKLFVDSHCFVVSDALLQEADRRGLDTRRLGYCVRFKKPCGASPVNNNPDACYACPHKFGCDCPTKYQDYWWCPHIHVAEKRGLDSYPQMRLLIHDYDSSTAEMRHLRAWIQGEDFMERTNEPPADVDMADYAEFTEKSPSIPGSVRQKINVCKPRLDYNCICTPDKICYCGACYCRYECTCDDWAVNLRTCQHCHWVAMVHFKELRLNPFASPPPTSLFQKYTPGEDRAGLDVTKDYKLALELQHELSFNVDDKLMPEFNKTSTKWEFGDNIKVIRRTKKVCSICDSDKTCPHCKICIHLFQCTCDDGNIGRICWHQHYVGRQLTPDDRDIEARWTHHRRKTLIGQRGTSQLPSKK